MPNFHMRRPPWAVYGESQRASPGRRHPRHRRHLAHSLAVRSGIPFPHHRRGHVGPRGLSRGNRLLAARRFELPAGPWGSLVWARGPRVCRPTGNPTSLGCWRLRFKSGRTHFNSGSKLYLSPRGFLIDGLSQRGDGTTGLAFTYRVVSEVRVGLGKSSSSRYPRLVASRRVLAVLRRWNNNETTITGTFTPAKKT